MVSNVAESAFANAANGFGINENINEDYAKDCSTNNLSQSLGSSAYGIR